MSLDMCSYPMALQKSLPKMAVKASSWGEIAVTADLGKE